ncbi:hypothetical protein scyTo_0000476 [Scyliorhinus torazame]|uniref:BTB/POZ domain-containing protein 16 n=1 Tax=Scyliorhinus torazame TaxID=75743 RepID=A0A401NY73_SCYTO|nr:hypothetical protein [Scyliorhinus torazame]
MGSRLGDSNETCTELERYFSDPQLSYHPLLPPRFRNNGIQRSAALLKVPFIALSDYMPKNPYQILNKISLPEKVRTQAGITNRFQITKHLGSDLLGRAQASRAIQVCFNETLQKILTADVPAAIWKIEENDLCSSPTQVSSCMPYLPKCSSISKTGSPIKPVYYKRRVPEAIKPKEFSCCYSRRLRDSIPTDVILESMNTLWELHSHFLPKSEVLYELLITSDQSEYFRNKLKEAPDTCPTGSLYYCGPEGECCESQLQKLKSCNLCNVHDRENHWVPLNTRNLKRIISLKLDVKDPFVTQEGFATALGNLYYDEPYVEPEYILSVFAAASVLKFMTLFHKCVSVMLDNINVTTVCFFHRAASKYNQEKLVQACERWMELNLIVHLRYDASLRHLQEEVLQKVLLSPSLQKMIVYLEKEIRQKYFGLFQAVRLHGITETRQIEELQQIDLLPRDWQLYVVTRNYYAEPWYHSEMISHCGFYFELKAVQEKKASSYGFFMQRINPADSSIPFGITEHNAFSLRRERKVKYDIQVQAMVKEEWQVFSTGYICQKFGVTKKSSLSKVLLVAGLTMPVYVTFALLFPVS